VQNRGRSTVLVTADGGRATIVDEGVHELDERHPGGGMLQTTRWRTEWTGKAREAKGKLRFDLAGAARCTRSEKHTEGTDVRELDTGCPRTPAKLRVDCERGEVVAAGKTHKVWHCRSPKTPPGTVQPWVFGIDVILDERLSGEPRPEARYTVR
jgi:hypothetical protein